MKKTLISLLFISITGISNAQTKFVDSLKTVLTNTSNSLERFNLLTKILENQSFFRGGNIDSADCIRLLQIARQLKNDSLLATSYNWIGSYFSFTKGDNATALEYYFKALPFAEKSNVKRRISSLDFDISLAYYALQNIKRLFNMSAREVMTYLINHTPCMILCSCNTNVEWPPGI